MCFTSKSVAVRLLTITIRLFSSITQLTKGQIFLVSFSYLSSLQLCKWYTEYFVLEPWRSDGRCGLNNPLDDGRPGQCDPNANANEKGPCCSSLGWCGNSDAHCKCAGCQDFTVHGSLI